MYVSKIFTLGCLDLKQELANLKNTIDSIEPKVLLSIQGAPVSISRDRSYLLAALSPGSFVVLSALFLNKSSALVLKVVSSKCLGTGTISRYSVDGVGPY